MEGDIVERHRAAARRMIKSIKSVEQYEMNGIAYDFIPVLLSESATVDTLEELPSLVGNYFVKCVVEGTKLWMISLSSSLPHSAAVAAALGQAGQWSYSMNSGLIFGITSDGNHQFEEKCIAPDKVVSVSGRFRPNGRDAKMLIIEIEVSNRSIPRMRSDYLQYFELGTVVAVVGIKLLPYRKAFL